MLGKSLVKKRTWAQQICIVGPSGTQIINILLLYKKSLSVILNFCNKCPLTLILLLKIEKLIKLGTFTRSITVKNIR